MSNPKESIDIKNLIGCELDSFYYAISESGGYNMPPNLREAEDEYEERIVSIFKDNGYKSPEEVEAILTERKNFWREKRDAEPVNGKWIYQTFLEELDTLTALFNNRI